MFLFQNDKEKEVNLIRRVILFGQYLFIIGFEKFEYCINYEKIDIFLVLIMYIFFVYSMVNKIYKIVGFY